MRKELKEVFNELIKNSKIVVVDNDFEAAYNIRPVAFEKHILLEATYLLLAILEENAIYLDDIYDLK